MPTLQLFVLGIDQVRDIFGAADELAVQLRAIATDRFASPEPQRSLLERLGPLFKRSPATQIDPRKPTPADVDALLAGSFIESERLSQCWQLLLVWLEQLATAQTSLQISDWEALEFDLGRAGLPSQVDLRHLAGRELGISLRPLPGQLVGYSKHQQIIETRGALHQLQLNPEHNLEPQTTALITELLALLDQVPPAADLVVIQPPPAPS